MTLPNWIKTDQHYEGIEEDRRNTLVPIFEAELLAKISPPERTPEMLKRVNARANLRALMGALMLDELRDGYVLWAFSDAEDTGWWKYLGGDEEFDDFQSWLENWLATMQEKDGRGRTTSEYSNWRFLIRKFIPYMRSLGLSLKEAIQFVSLKTKARRVVPLLQPIFRQMDDRALDPETANAQIWEILGMAVNPEVTSGDLEQLSAGHKPKPPKIPAQGTGYYISNPQGGGMVVMRVDSSSQVKALEKAVGPLTDNPEAAFFPRDGMAMANEVKEMFVKGSYEVAREPLAGKEPPERLIIPIDLNELIKNGQGALAGAIGKVVTDRLYALKGVEFYSHLGNELHLLVQLDYID